jgi:hypothetical protein
VRADGLFGRKKGQGVLVITGDWCGEHCMARVINHVYTLQWGIRLAWPTGLPGLNVHVLLKEWEVEAIFLQPAGGRFTKQERIT